MALDPRRNTGLLSVIWGMITGTNTPRQVAVDVDGRLLTAMQDDGWTVATISSTAINDSDKTFAVPANFTRHILGIWVEFTSTAAVGDRQLVIEVQIAGPDVTAQWARAGAVQAASLTRYYEFAPGLADLTAFRDTDYLTTPIPVTSILKAGDVLRVYDNNAVAAAADDMIVHIQYADRRLP